MLLEKVFKVDWVIGSTMESLSKLGEEISQLQAESILSEKDFGAEARRLRESIEKDQGMFSCELNQNLDGWHESQHRSPSRESSIICSH